MTSACQQIKCSNKDCAKCKHAVFSPRSVYCGKLRERVNHTARCPHFELEPVEYKLYRRM